MEFHFCFLGSRRWSDIYTLCLRSCLLNASPLRVVVHHDHNGEGDAWEAARKLNVTWKPVEEGKNETEYRFELLYTHGGWAASLDFLFIKRLPPIHKAPVIGIENRQRGQLHLELVGAPPNAPFVGKLLEWARSGPLPTTTMLTAADMGVSIVARNTFYPISATNSAFWIGAPIRLAKSSAVYLWESKRPTLTVATLRATALAPLINTIEAGMCIATGAVKNSGPGFITFA
jgi:hypothetical protein